MNELRELINGDCRQDMAIIDYHISEAAKYEQLAEEATELAHAALKMARVKRGENPTPVSLDDCLHNLYEESAQVEACKAAVRLYDDNELIKKSLSRWAKRILEEQRKKKLYQAAKNISEMGFADACEAVRRNLCVTHIE